jgi:hypothetical protein
VASKVEIIQVLTMSRLLLLEPELYDKKGQVCVFVSYVACGSEVHELRKELLRETEAILLHTVHFNRPS